MNNQPVPVSIITGFLGSGKTTLLNRLLQGEGLANSLVIINEFGEIGIDHLLVSTPNENMRLLSNGCLCCEVRGDLVETLADAARQRAAGTIPAFDRVIVETTGLADPVPLVQTVVSDRDVSPSYRLDSVITMVDAVNALSQIDQQPESVKQIAVSDLLLISKSDIAEAGQIESVKLRVRGINGSVEVMEVRYGDIDPRLLFGRGAVSEETSASRLERWLGHAATCTLDHHEHCGHEHHHDREHAHTAARHDDRVQTFSIVLDTPATTRSFTVWLTMLASFRGVNLLRVKGIVNVEGRPLVINAVQAVLHDPIELKHWPSDDQRTRIVFIVRELDRGDLEKTVESLLLPDELNASTDALDPKAYAQFMQMAKPFM